MGKAFIIFLLLFPVWVDAQANVNAGVVPALWYSQIEVYEGDEIRIYGAIQNHSNVRFKGEAIFLLDGVELSRTNFSSSPGELVEVESKAWIAVKGEYKTELRIEKLSPQVNAISLSSGEVELEVKNKITFEEVKQTAAEAFSEAEDRGDAISEVLAEKILSYQRPAREAETLLDESVLGTSTESRKGGVLNKPAVASVFNMVLGFLAELVKHWKWTLGGIAGLWLVLKLFKK